MSGIEVAVIGNGGREHEIGRVLNNSDEVDSIYFLDGNAGTETLEKAVNVDIRPDSIQEIVRFAHAKKIGLTVIGPEVPLSYGLADRLREHDLLVFGPNRDGAKIETSKRYAVKFMSEFGIRHPMSQTVHDLSSGLFAMQRLNPRNYVLKADGLSGGKDVFLPDNIEDSKLALQHLFSNHKPSSTGRKNVIIQSRYHGSELSAFVVTDGDNFTLLPFSQDHKRLEDGDKGPNTGGMGAYSPITESILNKLTEEKIHDIAERTIAGLKKRNTPYQGVIYIGLMLAEELDREPVVLEYNARFGDPEAQVILPLLEQSGVDVFKLLLNTAEGQLDKTKIINSVGRSALTVCLASEGYPIQSHVGDDISGLTQDYPDVIIHHGATLREKDKIKTNGGRVLYLTGLGKNVDQAAEKSYGALSHINFPGMQYRTDIGYQARTSPQILE
ncbi:MAG TPA: phosphoribosylamine--glycine ligase [Patescibacteria group bacterium]|nr:phosphoribosylamine--glycine ligase [Patescibacteria group bacterium]